jgi:molecular chaperone DnaK
MKLGEAMYQQASGSEGASSGDTGAGQETGGTSGTDEGVVDADFEEVDEEEKKKGDS